MYWWRRFDRREVDEDYARIRWAGFDAVRIFLLWEDFQPEPERVAPEALTWLVAVADTAVRHGLSLMPTLFTGHMSGVNWIPAWALDPGGTSPRFRVVTGGRGGGRFYRARPGRPAPVRFHRRPVGQRRNASRAKGRHQRPHPSQRTSPAAWRAARCRRPCHVCW
jgi:hypothetical protein